MDNVRKDINDINVAIGNLTTKIRGSLSTVDRTYFDVQTKIKTIQGLSKVEGEIHKNELGSFFAKRIDEITNDIKKASLAQLRADKERLDNIKNIAKSSIDGTTQGKGVYDQYEVLNKKLEEEINSRKRLTFKMGAFLEKNGVDAISIVSALTTRNPIIGLGIKYILEKKKTDKEEEARKRAFALQDSFAYRDILTRQKIQLEKQDALNKKKAAVEANKAAKPKNTSEESAPKKSGKRKKSFMEQINEEGESSFDGAPQVLNGSFEKSDRNNVPKLFRKEKPGEARREDLLALIERFKPKAQDLTNDGDNPTVQLKRNKGSEGTSTPSLYTEGTKPVLDSLTKVTVILADIKKQNAQFHREDHLTSEKQSDEAEEAKLDGIKQNSNLMETLRGGGKGSSNAAGPKEHGGKGPGIIKQTIEKQIAKKVLSKIPGLGKIFGAGGGAGASQGAGAAGGVISAATLSLVAGLVWAVIDTTIGYFKSEKWGVGKAAGALGGLFGGVFEGKMLNVFANAGKFALLGAGIGSVVPGIGTLVGGIIGAVIGAVLGYFGGEKIAQGLESSGLGRFVGSSLNLIWSTLKLIGRAIWQAAKIAATVGHVLFKIGETIWKIGSKIFDVFMKPLEPVMEKIGLVGPKMETAGKGFTKILNFLSDLFDWIANQMDNSLNGTDSIDKMFKTVDDAFASVLSSIQSGLLNWAASMLEAIPGWIPGSSSAHETAKAWRSKAKETTENESSRRAKSIEVTSSTDAGGNGSSGETKQSPPVTVSKNTPSSIPSQSSGSSGGEAPQDKGRTADGKVVPVSGDISSVFGNRQRGGKLEGHGAIDVATKVGTPVYATDAGVVLRANGTDDPNGYGNLIDIMHEDGYMTRYGHLSAFKVKKGDKITKGELIGKSGGGRGVPGAGNSEGPHLHFEVRKGGPSGPMVDPSEYMARSSYKKGEVLTGGSANPPSKDQKSSNEGGGQNKTETASNASGLPTLKGNAYGDLGPGKTQAKDLKYSPGKVPPEIAKMAKDEEARTGVPAEVTIAQWATESGWGKSSIGNNAFGVKRNKNSKKWETKNTEENLTWEEFQKLTPEEKKSATEINGGTLQSEWKGKKKLKVNQDFAQYDSLEESFKDHSRVLAGNKKALENYKKNKNTDEYVREISPAYSTNGEEYTKTVGGIAKSEAVKKSVQGPVLVANNPTQGKALMSMQKQVEDNKSDITGAQIAASRSSPSVLNAPSTTNVSNNTSVTQQQAPHNTENTFRDVRYRQSYHT